MSLWPCFPLIFGYFKPNVAIFVKRFFLTSGLSLVRKKKDKWVVCFIFLFGTAGVKVPGWKPTVL